MGHTNKMNEGEKREKNKQEMIKIGKFIAIKRERERYIYIYR